MLYFELSYFLGVIVINRLNNKQLIWLMCVADPICDGCRVVLREEGDGVFYILGLMPESDDVAFFTPLFGFPQGIRLGRIYNRHDEYNPLSNGNVAFRLQNSLGLSTHYDKGKNIWRVHTKSENDAIIEYVDENLNKAIAKVVIDLKFKGQLPDLPKELTS